RENVARDVQAILNDRPEYMPMHTSSDENGALLVWIAQKFINADPAELLYCDGSGDGQIDIFHSQQVDGSIAFTVYQVHAPDLAHISEGKQKEVKGKLLDDVRGLCNNLFEQ